ncbi:helix-hairpin-helix domain-containing protein [Pontibacter sp. MBLB2868]|uniref:ComEA family DNA-binding protein n=1 Tax=Pontibacter sp. MBLB2868 TaxID=3451555 RepID=UPI003F74E5E4
MKRIRYWIRRYFAFSQREVNGFLWLISIMVLLTVAPFLFNKLYQPRLSDNTLADIQELDSLVALLETKQPDAGSRKAFFTLTDNLRPFNPNKVTVEEWQEMGLPKFMAQRIMNYRNKVGDFTYKAELGKMYGLPDSVFQKLYPYIQLPTERPAKYGRNQGIAASNNVPRPEWAKRAKERFILVPFSINTADTAQLKQIRGIGSKLSARIIKYRNSLGGFTDISQLKEVYGLQPEVVDSLKKYTFVPKAINLNQLSLNTATSEQLKTHPYISSNIARAIVSYREQHGNYEHVEDVQQVKLISAELFNKLKPYLTL